MKIKIMKMQLELKNEAETKQFAEDLALCLQCGDMVALCGDLGTGKSVLARALIRALADNAELEIPSPTFTLMQIYEEARIPAAHADIYRLSAAEELDELGFQEFLQNGIILVEWADKFPSLLEQAQFYLHLRETGQQSRILTIKTAEEAGLRLRHSLAVRSFLQKHGRGHAARRFLQGDASPRAYEKLLLPKNIGAENTEAASAERSKIEILMDAPPIEIHDKNRAAYLEKAHLATHNRQFVAIDTLLCRSGFKAPQIYAKNTEETLLILEDLGTESLLHKKNKTPIEKRYIACGAFLAEFHQTDWIKSAQKQHCHVPQYDEIALQTEADLFADWYLPHKTGKPAANSWRENFRRLWQPLFAELQQGSQTLVLRDFHSPNILWQSKGAAKKRIGLIDFQDAVLGSPAYDLVSLAQDARVTISPSLEEQIIRAYKTMRQKHKTPFDAQIFDTHYAILGAQRACKILGVFIRLNHQDAKAHYMRHLPRIENYLRHNLNAAVLQPLRQFFAESKLL